MAELSNLTSPDANASPRHQARKLAVRELAAALLATGVILGCGLAMWVLGGTARWTSLAVGVLPLLYFFAAGLYLQRQRRRAGGRRFQFGMPFLLITLTIASVWLALARWDYVQMIDLHSRREKTEAEIRRIVGAGEVHLSQQLVVQVKRTTFNDGDLRRLLATQEGLHEAGADFNWLDLSNTAVTDAGVRQLAACDQLEYLFLNGTAVSDAGFKTAARLPNLKIISVEGARVSPEALAGIRAERPQLRITPAGGK